VCYGIRPRPTIIWQLDDRTLNTAFKDFMTIRMASDIGIAKDPNSLSFCSCWTVKELVIRTISFAQTRDSALWSIDQHKTEALVVHRTSTLTSVEWEAEPDKVPFRNIRIRGKCWEHIGELDWKERIRADWRVAT
jgi:hypothetical protein